MQTAVWWFPEGRGEGDIDKCKGSQLYVDGKKFDFG